MLREETVEPSTLELLRRLTSISELSQFRLVGDTALSLLLGHRKSIDLDFFSDQPFDERILREILENTFQKVSIRTTSAKSIMQGFIEDIKVDFVSVRDPFNNPPTIIDKIPLADIRDIAALKLNAIKGRGAKKDFWDLAKLLELYSLENLLDFYSKRYPYDDTFAVMRSIVYFEDADAEPDPLSLEQKSWKEVKEIIETAFKEYYNKK